MKTIILVLLLSLGFAFQGSAQEVIAESNATTAVFNNETFTTEITKIQVVLDMVYVRWNDDGTGGVFRFDIYLQTESGDRITGTSLNRAVSILDTTNSPTSVHKYIRDQAVGAVESVDPFGLTVWVKAY